MSRYKTCIKKGLNKKTRYSFRIVCDRDDVDKCRIFAGGFDSHDKLYLGPSALSWGYKRDGLVVCVFLNVP